MFEVSSGAYTGASPALASGVAYYGTFENEVLAVDLKTPKVLWRYTHPQRPFPFYSSAAVAGGKVVVGGRDKLVHAIDAKSGKPLWTFPTQARVESSPAISGNTVFIAQQRRPAVRDRPSDRRERPGNGTPARGCPPRPRSRADGS
jgi:outer membrane protein assembly factor BamB